VPEKKQGFWEMAETSHCKGFQEINGNRFDTCLPILFSQPIGSFLKYWEGKKIKKAPNKRLELPGNYSGSFPVHESNC